MVRSSTASTLATPANEPDCVQPVCSSVQYCQVKTASSAVTGVPSDQTRPSLRVQVMDIRSSATPPFSVVGTSAASAGTISVVGPKNARGSSTIDAAMVSLVPLESIPLTSDGACHMSSCRCPPCPASPPGSVVSVPPPVVVVCPEPVVVVVGVPSPPQAANTKAKAAGSAGQVHPFILLLQRRNVRFRRPAKITPGVLARVRNPGSL